MTSAQPMIEARGVEKWYPNGFHALRGVDLFPFDRQGARPHRLPASVEQRMAGAASVPELQDDAAPRPVHGLGHPTPAFHLGVVEDARLTAAEGRMALQHHGGLGDQQASPCPLGVVRGHQRPRHMACLGTAAGERRVQHPVRQLQRSDRQGSEQIGHGEGGWR